MPRRSHHGRWLVHVQTEGQAALVARLRQICQLDLAIELQADQTSLSLWARGVTKPRANRLARVSAQLGINPARWAAPLRSPFWLRCSTGTGHGYRTARRVDAPAQLGRASPHAT